MVWEWQVWRCVGDLAEEFEARGWEMGFKRDELPPALGRSGCYSILFCDRDAATGERRFELRDDRRIVALKDIPAPEGAEDLLSERGTPLEGDYRRRLALG